MLKVWLMLLKFAACERGATAIEYALIVSGISMAIIAAVNTIGVTLNTNYTAMKTALN